MTVFLDSNIILDILLKNPAGYEESRKLMLLADRKVDFFISASSITDIFYIANKHLRDKQKTKDCLSELLEIVSVAGVDEQCIRNALNSSWSDFEDSVQNESAAQIRADYIVTRNVSDFKMAFVQVISPKGFLESYFP